MGISANPVYQLHGITKEGFSFSVRCLCKVLHEFGGEHGAKHDRQTHHISYYHAAMHHVVNFFCFQQSLLSLSQP